MSTDEEFQKFLDDNFPHWNSKMVTPGFEFDMEKLKQIEGPMESELSEHDFQYAGEINGKKTSFKACDWLSSMKSQKG